MWVDGSGIAHVVDPAPKEGLYRRSEVKGNHPGGDGSHARSLDARGWCLVGCLRGVGGAIIGAIAADRDSSADTGAGCHCIAWEVREGKGCMRGRWQAI